MHFCQRLVVGGTVDFSERSIAGNKLDCAEESLNKGDEDVVQGEDADGTVASAAAEAKCRLELDESSRDGFGCLFRGRLGPTT